MVEILYLIALLFIILTLLFWCLKVVNHENKEIKELYFKWWIGLQEDGYKFIILFPLALTKYLYDRIFGKKIFSRKSFIRLFFISFILNLICFLMILSGGKQISDMGLMLELFANFCGFALANSIGDMSSLAITRILLAKVLKTKNLFILVFDFLGIIFGYFVSYLFSCLMVFGGYLILDSWEVYPLIKVGLGGMFTIPGVLLIFWMGGKGMIFTIFAVFSFFSIMIPTLVYLMITLILIILPKKQQIAEHATEFLEKLEKYSSDKKVSVYEHLQNFTFGVAGVLTIIAAYLSVKP